MPNQFKTHTSDAGTTIHLKMNGELIENLIALDCIAITLFDIVFVYGVYEVYAENDGALTLVLIFLVLPFISTYIMNIEKINDGLKMQRKYFLFLKTIFTFPKNVLGKNC
ncbi:hypothetical protein MWF93_14315 [Acinetobacter baumannii]|nr:hypothetical protein [Acinetobacter baumannii]